MSHKKMMKHHFAPQHLWILKGCVFIHLLPRLVISRNTELFPILRTGNEPNQKHLPPVHPCENAETCFNKGKCIPEEEGNEYSLHYHCSCGVYTMAPSCYEDANICDFPMYKESECNREKGKCSPTWGHYFCDCDDGMGGLLCTESFTGTRMKYPMFLFDPDMYSGHTHFFLAYINSNIEGDDLNFDITFDDGHTFSSKVIWMETSLHSYDKLFASENIKRRLMSDGPIRRALLFPYTFEVTEEPIHWVKFMFKNGDQAQYGRRWSLYMWQHPFECVPRVALKDCSRATQDMMLIQRRRRHVFRGQVTRHCAALNTTLKYKWILYDVAQTNIPFDSGSLLVRYL